MPDLLVGFTVLTLPPFYFVFLRLFTPTRTLLLLLPLSLLGLQVCSCFSSYYYRQRQVCKPHQPQLLLLLLYILYTPFLPLYLLLLYYLPSSFISIQCCPHLDSNLLFLNKLPICDAELLLLGVQADGRCLFRAIAHAACLQRGEDSPDQNRQTQLADKLRAQIVDELVKRRKEVEWFIEEDFDAYVKRIQQPYIWSGEPELLMASHVLEKLVTVFMKDTSTGEMRKIANYGEEYKKKNEAPINVLFHGYGHYDILETCSST